MTEYHRPLEGVMSRSCEEVFVERRPTSEETYAEFEVRLAARQVEGHEEGRSAYAVDFRSTQGRPPTHLNQ
jgi:hypothetical protein